MLQLLEQRVVAGTAQELAKYLQSAELGDTQLTLLVPVEDYSDFFPAPPVTIRDQAHLEELLLEGLESGEATPVTCQEWKEIRAEVHARHAQRHGSP